MMVQITIHMNLLKKKEIEEVLSKSQIWKKEKLDEKILGCVKL